MPELPEVEAARRAVERAARGKTLARVEPLHPAAKRRVADAGSIALLAALEGQRLVRVERRGKHQLLHFETGALLHVHLRMNGDWHVGRTDASLPRYAVATLAFVDGTRVSLVDSRALASLLPHAAGVDPLPALGPEATDASLTPVALRTALARKRIAIKPALLDQRVVAGLGNIYAAEALWIAKVKPTAVAASLSVPRLTRIIAGMREALAGGTGDPGRYSRGEATERINVYDREGEPCARCGSAIRRIVQAGRSTYYCANCQR